MGKVTESIFDGVTAVIPLAEVGYVSKFKNCMVIHFNSGVELTLIPPEQNAFLAAWCKYRSELESNTLMDFEGAQPAPSVPEGWKLVPIEPTPGMIDAAEYVDWGDADVRGSCINAWDRMLAAAPEARP